MPFWCSACGYQLDDPETDLYDVESDGELTDEHIKLTHGPKGDRYHCTETGQITKIIEEPPEQAAAEDEPPSGGSGQSGEPQPQPNPSPEHPQGQPRQPVYDLEEENDAMDLLFKVVGNPAYELDEQQVEEVGSWAEIYDGQIPPQTLENILQNMSGVSKQKASLMRQKYEALLNKWAREQAEGNRGPGIGVMAPPNTAGQQMPSSSGGGQASGPPRQRGAPPDRNEPEVDEQFEGPPEDGVGEIRQDRREHRVERRQEVVDTMAEEMARNMASDAGKFYSDMREVLTTLIKKKAERDPDWFFEKADAFGMDILDELAQPSEAKQREQQAGGGQSQADAEVDAVLDQMQAGGGQPEPRQQEPHQPEQSQQGQPREPQEQPQQSPSADVPDEMRPGASPAQRRGETSKSQGDARGGSHPMQGEPPQQSQQEESDNMTEDDAFDEIMGDLSE